MIVRQFLQWIRNAAPGERAEATSALARAYLYSDLSPDDRVAAEGAMIMLLDDSSPLVRLALAEALAASEEAPPAVIHALAGDQAEIAVPVLARSPLFIDAELVDIVALGEPPIQCAVARRAHLPSSVAAAIAEVGVGRACLVLLENSNAEIADFSIDRIVDRFGHLATIRELMFARDDLPAATRQALVSKLSHTLAEFVAARDWLSCDRAERVAKEACEKATIALAAGSRASEVRPLIRHLCRTGQLTAGLILRALLSGNLVMFEESLGELSRLPLNRVRALVHDKGSAGFRALYERAALPLSAYPAFREAVAAMQEAHEMGEARDASRLKRRMIERVLTGCEDAPVGEIESLLILLRRFATEAARDEARLYCKELVADSYIGFDEAERAAA